MKSLLLSSLSILILLTVAASVEAAPDTTSTHTFDPSWSLDYRVNPQQVSINGLPVNDVSQSLTHIEIFTCDSDRFFSLEQCRQIQESGGQLQAVLDLNNDGRLERWSTGVAKNIEGELVKILVIQDHLNGNVIQMITLHDSEPGFSALYQQGDYFMWAMCISCDVFADIEWHNNDYKLAWDWMAAANSI